MNAFTTTLIALGLMAPMSFGALSVTVPQATSQGQMLVSTSTGNWVATTTNPLTAGAFTSTSTTRASIFPYASSTSFTVSGNAYLASTNLTGITGSTQCLRVDTNGLISGAGSDCASSAGNWATTSEAYYWSQFRDWTVQGDGYLAPTTTRGIILSASSTISGLTSTNGTTTNATSTNLYVSGDTRLASLSGLLKATTGVVSVATAGTDYANFGYLFPSNATSTLLTFTGGILVNNSTSTITNLVMTEATTTNATTTNLSISGTLDVDGLTSALTLTGSTGIFAEYAGTSCTNQFVRSLDAVGGATCATVSSGDVSLANLTATDSTLTFSGTYNGATARTIGLNLTSANVWTASTTFTGGLTAVTGTTTYATSTNLYVSSSVSIASTSPIRTLSVHGNAIISGDVFLGATTTATTSEQYLGRISPWRYLSLSTATTTTWTATTSAGYVPFVTSPFTGTLRDVSCTASSTSAFLGVAPFIGTTPTTPSYFIASTTVGRVTFTANNTFTVGQSIGMSVGTTTTDANAKSLTCSFRITETP